MLYTQKLDVSGDPVRGGIAGPGGEFGWWDGVAWDEELATGRLPGGGPGHVVIWAWSCVSKYKEIYDSIYIYIYMFFFKK